jgi:hypothetical protein
MIEERDPTALSLLSQYRGLRMPELGLTEKDAEDVITFIEMGGGATDHPDMIGAVKGHEAEGKNVP